MRSHVWMTIGLAAGLVLGLVAATTQLPTLITAATGLRPLGTLFLNLLSMVVIPLVVTALFAGVAGLGSVRGGRRLGRAPLGTFAPVAGAVAQYGGSLLAPIPVSLLARSRQLAVRSARLLLAAAVLVVRRQARRTRKATWP